MQALWKLAAWQGVNLEERIKVNGEVCTMRGKKIRPGDKVQIDEIATEIVVK